jgi:predicted amidophosphoribosyltransferase
MPGGGRKALSARICRDCEYEIEPHARGCPQCALNLDAENMIDRFIWRRLIPGLVIVAAFALIVWRYLLR